MGGFSLYLIVAGALILGPVSAMASGEKARCSQAVKKAAQECTQAAQGAEAAGNAHNAGGTGQDAGHGGQGDRGAGNLCPRLQNQKKNLDAAKGKCAAAKQKCTQTCNQEKTKDTQHSSTVPPQHPPENPDPAECGQATDPKMADMAKAAAPLDGQAAEACKSGDEAKDKAGGAPPPTVPPITPEEKKEAEKKDAMKCDSSEGVRYSDCNGVYTAKCTANMLTSGCTEFADRFCGSATAGKQADVAISGGTESKAENFAKAQSLKTQSSGFKTASVVVDKGGEGLGSGFCRMVSAYKFCQASGRGDCPSCKGAHDYNSPVCQNDPSKCIGSLSNEGLVAAKNKCPTDPVFLDPAVQKKLIEAEAAKKEAVDAVNGGKVPEKTGAGAATGGGGGGLAGGTGAAAGGVGIDGATPESLPVGTAIGINNGGGGGGGSYSESAATEDEEEDRKPSGLREQSILPAESVTGMPRDISNQFGPNVFSISSAVYRSMCGKGTLTRCKPKQ